MQSKRFIQFKEIVLNHLHHVKGKLILAALCLLGFTLAELLGPWPFKIIFDHILFDKPLSPHLSFLGGLMASGKERFLLLISFAVVLIALLRGVSSYLQIYVTSRIGYQMVYALRRELFAHLQRLSISFHNRARSGELLTRVASDTNSLKDLFAESILNFTTHLVILIGMLGIMFALNWQLSLIVLATLPPLFYALLYLFRDIKASAETQRKREGKIASRISEILGSVTVVQAFGREKYENELFDAESAGALEQSVRTARIEAATTRTVEMITAVGKWAVVLIGSWQVLKGRMTPGDILIFWSYVGKMYKPIRNLVKLSTKFTRAMVSIERITEILQVEPPRDDPDAIDATNLKGEIVFKNVSFDYGDGKGVLKDASFTILPGQRVALVGPSGAGKSTIVSLILRLFDPQDGSILTDGMNIKLYRRESLRRQIGVVLQDSILFGASIKENIAFGKPDATPDEIVAAAKAANAHDFILELEHGYDTTVGERGVTLSGGQRQRIAIARALIRNAPILILDEPTTGLDVESGAKIQQALKRLMAGKTCLLITHDLDVAADADVVLVLEDGQIVEQGSHRDLLARNGQYHQIYELKVGSYEGPNVSMEKV